MKLLNKCPVCGSALMYSELMQYSLDSKIKKNGEISKKFKKSEADPMDSCFISCTNAVCDFTTDCNLECEKYRIRIFSSEGKFYYKDSAE